MSLKIGMHLVKGKIIPADKRRICTCCGCSKINQTILAHRELSETRKNGLETGRDKI